MKKVLKSIYNYRPLLFPSPPPLKCNVCVVTCRQSESNCYSHLVFRLRIRKATEQQEPIYSPLTCELCSETFTVPAEWVRHIESHSEAAHCVPKKRKHIEVNQNLWLFPFPIFHYRNPIFGL